MENRERKTSWQREDYGRDPEKYRQATRRYRAAHPKPKFIGPRRKPGRALQTHCKHGHELSPDNLYSYVTATETVRQCKQCMTNKNRRRSQQLRDSHLKRHFNITQARYDDMLAAQDGRCKLCRATKPGGMGAFHIDHDHLCCPGNKSCGRCIRGLVCRKCNDCIGKANESAALLQRGADYVRQWDRVRHLRSASRARAPYLLELEDRLLELGGQSMVLWGGNNSPKYVADLLQAGVLYATDGAVHRPMGPNKCHDNTVRLADCGYRPVTGYALSFAGIWYPHSWCVDADSRLIETTVFAKQYFGMPWNNPLEAVNGSGHFVLTEED